MSFNDIFKSSYLENITAVSIPDMAIALILSFCLGLFIYFVYRKTYAGVMFSQSFGGSLIAMTMITTMVILAVTSNVVLSLSASARRLRSRWTLRSCSGRLRAVSCWRQG